jgi:hypothetical protein
MARQVVDFKNGTIIGRQELSAELDAVQNVVLLRSMLPQNMVIETLMNLPLM